MMFRLLNGGCGTLSVSDSTTKRIVLLVTFEVYHCHLLPDLARRYVHGECSFLASFDRANTFFRCVRRDALSRHLKRNCKERKKKKACR